MRHVFGLLIGLVVTAVLLLGAGWAAAEMGLALQPAQGVAPPVAGTGQNWAAPAAMAGIGLLLGLVVVGRVSPVASFIPSLVLLSWTVVYVLDAGRGLGFLPVNPTFHEALLQAGRGMRILLTTGVYALVGVALFLPVLLPSRWAGSGGDEDDDEYEESNGRSSY
ncbi:hypothetical protein [Planomonospora sp. ID82291]|uniref:hypothetical protein n=1 Tax=Planomonospora sp. ID82291 TaxID=2738136 RepID=UPI0018C3A455|nr:hypothetical protein [Planomonospora sp. ID82291]MBG0817773.1 hypothetical protein [Planomonospora sp. ID82291]